MKPNYEGSILMLKPDNKINVKSVYHLDYGECEFYNLPVKVELNENLCYIEFYYQNEPFELVLKNQGKGHFKGDLFVYCDYSEPLGGASLELFRNEMKIILIGDYNEVHSGYFNCFVELREIS